MILLDVFQHFPAFGYIRVEHDFAWESSTFNVEGFRDNVVVWDEE